MDVLLESGSLLWQVRSEPKGNGISPRQSCLWTNKITLLRCLCDILKTGMNYSQRQETDDVCSTQWDGKWLKWRE